MTELSIATTGATKIAVPPDDLTALKGSLRGARLFAGRCRATTRRGRSGTR